MCGARFSSLIGRAPGREKRRWTRHRILGFVAGVASFVVVVSSLSPVASRLTVGLILAIIAFTFDDLIPREMRLSSLAIMSLMTVAVVALWMLIVERLLRGSALCRDRR